MENYFPLSMTSIISPNRKIIDLTHSYSNETIYWPTEEGFKIEKEFDGITENGYYYSANKFCSPEHGGTHMDAPIHFAQDKATVEMISLEKLISQAIVIDVSEKSLSNADYQITKDDFKDWESSFGRIPDNSIILCYTGFGKFWPDRLRYIGTKKFGERAIKELHFPGLHSESAKWLIENRKINAIGLDTPSIDYGQSKTFETHRVLCFSGIPIFENLANLNKLPPLGSFIVALPMKIKGGSGAPLRIVALI